MAKFRKEPIVIEATQWWPGVEIEGVVLRSGPGYTVEAGPHSLHGGPSVSVPVIETLEGELNVSPGDWIITGVAGERYPCKDKIFRATYDPVDDEALREWAS